MKKELIRQRLQVNLQKLEAAAARRLLSCRECYANQQDRLRTTTDFFLEVTSAEPPAQSAEQSRCTVDLEVLMDVDHMATAAILDKMATPETIACTDIVMASTPHTSTATSQFSLLTRLHPQRDHHRDHLKPVFVDIDVRFFCHRSQ